MARSISGGSGAARADVLISIVIPLFNVRRYLPECLDSVLGQRVEAGFEVIAVDDASDDGSGPLLDERAAADDRLTVIHTERNGGPGEARNLGLARAAGRYVWFVDGDDLIAPGALDAIGAKLSADQPDVLIVDYRELYTGGTERPSSAQALLHEVATAMQAQGSFLLADAPQLINATMTAWSKVFRREFLIGLGEPFRRGIHEDIPVSCAALLKGRLSVLDQACYRYRRSRPGSFMATSSTAHLDVFNAYEEVFAMVGKLVDSGDLAPTPEVRSAIFERAISHFAAVLGTTRPGVGRIGLPGLVPRRERRRFFERMHEDFARYEPDGYRLPAGARGAKLALIRRDAYWTYEVLEPVNQARVALRGVLRR